MKRFTFRLPQKRWQRAVLYACSTCLVLLGADMALTRYWRHITVSRETTYLTTPLNAAGTPDYLAWLNQQQAQGVTPENNAAVPIIQAAGTTAIESPEWQQTVMAGLGLSGETFPSKPEPDFVDWAWAQLKDMSPSVSDLIDQQNQMHRAPWKAADHPLWTRWLDARKEALDLAHQAAARSRFYVPLAPSHPRSEPGQLILAILPQLGATARLANLLLADAMCHAGDADKSVFIRDVTDSLKLGYLLTTRSVLFEDFVGFVIQRSSYKAIIAALETPEILRPSDARALLVAIQSLPPNAELDLLGERLALLDLCCYVSAYGYAHIPFGADAQPRAAAMLALVVPLHLNATMRDINRIYDQLDESLRLPNYRQRMVAINQLEDQLYTGSIAHVMWSTGMTASQLDSLFLDSLFGEHAEITHTCRMRQSARVRHDLTCLALALSVYKAEKGAYPDALASLAAPAASPLLKEIPNDGFSDAPLIYRKEATGYVLYSVGPDGKDDGGDDKKDEVVRIK